MPEAIPIPLGYENFDYDSKSNNRIIDTEFFIHYNRPANGPLAYRIDEYSLLDTQFKSVPNYEMKILNESNMDVRELEINSGCFLKLTARLSVKENIVGFHKLFMWMTFEGIVRSSPVSLYCSRFIYALHIVIRLCEPASDVELSSDARSFIPKSRLAFFDTPVGYVHSNHVLFF